MKTFALIPTNTNNLASATLVKAHSETHARAVASIECDLLANHRQYNCLEVPNPWPVLANILSGGRPERVPKWYKRVMVGIAVENQR